MSAELFKMMTVVPMEYLPYANTPAMLAGLRAGQVQFTFDSVTSSIRQIRAGKTPALAVKTAVRSDGLPEVPTLGDFVPEYEASGWFGFGAPRNTPADVVDGLNEETSRRSAIRRQRRSSWDLEATCSRDRPANSASWSPKKPKSGPGWSSSPA